MKNPDYNQRNCEKQLRKEAGGKSERRCSAYLIQLISTPKTATLLQGVSWMAQKQLWNNMWKNVFPGDVVRLSTPNNPLQDLNFWRNCTAREPLASFPCFPVAAQLLLGLIQSCARWSEWGDILDLLLLSRVVPGTRRDSWSRLQPTASFSSLPAGSCHYLGSSKLTATARRAPEQGAKKLSSAKDKEAAWLGRKA